MRNRLAYYVAAQYVGQIGEGDSYRQLTPSVGICVLDGMLFPQSPDLHLDFRFRSRNSTLELTDALQIHLLELPKYDPPGDNTVITDPIEKWAYFLRQAAELTPEQLMDRLGDPVFAEAGEVLNMIARNPKERELYKARLKMQRDEQSRIEAAEERGEARGRVKLLQKLLGQPESTNDDLANLSIDQLSKLEIDLQRQLRGRG